MSAGRVPGGIDSYCCDAPDFGCSVEPRSAIRTGAISVCTDCTPRACLAVVPVARPALGPRRILFSFC